MSKFQIDSFFRLNGTSLDQEELIDYAQKLMKSEEEHEMHFGTFILEWFDENDFIALTTSGTTGKPKTIQLKKAAMVNSAIATIRFFKLKKGCKALHCLPAQYIAGKMMLVRALVGGWELDWVKPDSNPFKNEDKHYDFAAMVPLQIENALSKIHNIQTIIIGGAKLNSGLVEKLKKVSSDIYETYGMTETITHIAAKKIQEDSFSVLPDIYVSKDKRGCLVIEAPHLSSEKIITNDVVDLVAKERFVWLGRVDNVINSGGIKLHPEKIEEKLSGRISQRFFVIGKPDLVLGEKLVLVIEGEDYPLEESVFETLQKYEKPKEIIFVKRFSETETGKIKRAESIQ